MNALTSVLNAARRLETIFPGFFPQAKHNHYRDFGFPETLTFPQLYTMYQRNGIAKAGVEKTIGKVWQEHPELWETEAPTESVLEGEVRQRFEDLRVWQRLADTERKSLVGGYAGVILRFADSKTFKEPVDTVPGGLAGLVEVIPAWAGQLKVSSYVTDQRSEFYGQPSMFSFNEAEVPDSSLTPGMDNKTRTFEVHPDRVLVWSDDGTVHAESLLTAGFNDLLTLEKVSGAGGEGFWKNAKSSPVLSIDKETQLDEMARGMGVAPDELADAMNEQVEDWQKGFDRLLLLQGMTAQTLGVTLPQPAEFFNIALQSFAASIGIPLKILVGNQTGERASVEDAKDWAETCMSRRSKCTQPMIRQFVNRLETVGILPEKDWTIGWTDLTESSSSEKLDRANRMSEINARSKDEVIFTGDEIREAVGYMPLADDLKFGTAEEFGDIA